MLSTEEKLAKSLTAKSVELIPHFPYLLQDLWELGSSPKDMIYLIANNTVLSENMHVLDLACGKGAVSVNVARRFGCNVKGIDIIPEFIEEAILKAREFGVETLCEFVVGDINQSVKTERDYDLVVLGAVGDVLGNPEATLKKLSATIIADGYVLIDDAYGRTDQAYITKQQWLKIIHKSGFQMIDDLIVDESELSDDLNQQMMFIAKRVKELKLQYPDQAQLFEQYLESQLAECEELNNDIYGVTILLKKAH